MKNLLFTSKIITTFAGLMIKTGGVNIGFFLNVAFAIKGRDLYNAYNEHITPPHFYFPTQILSILVVVLPFFWVSVSKKSALHFKAHLAGVFQNKYSWFYNPEEKLLSFLDKNKFIKIATPIRFK